MHFALLQSTNSAVGLSCSTVQWMQLSVIRIKSKSLLSCKCTYLYWYLITPFKEPTFVNCQTEQITKINNSVCSLCNYLGFLNIKRGNCVVLSGVGSVVWLASWRHWALARPLQDNDLDGGGTGLWHSLVAIIGHISPLDIVLTKDFCPGNPVTVLPDIFFSEDTNFVHPCLMS